MNKIVALALAAVLWSAHSKASAEAERYGSLETLSGVCFTNFENSVFVPCAGEKCKEWVRAEGYNLWCVPAVCSDLDSRVSALNGSNQRWGLFAITLEGRRTLTRHAPRRMYDRGQSLKLERIRSFALIKGQPN